MPEKIGKVKESKVENVRGLFGHNLPKSIWGSFAVGPEDLRFEAQHEDEEIIILGRRHPVTNLGWLTIVCFAVFIPTVWGSFPFFAALSTLTLTKITILWYLAMLFFVIQNFLLWFYNIYIVTNERLVDVDFVGLLSKTVNVTELDNVEDVNYSQNGLMDSFFNMGDVIVQTASEQKTQDASGELSAFTFEAIANPDKVSQIISKLVHDEEEQHYHRP